MKNFVMNSLLVLSQLDIVDSHPLVNLIFASSNSSSSTNVLYLLAQTWRHKSPGIDNQVGKEWPLGVHCWYEKSLSCGVALVAVQRRDLAILFPIAIL